MKERRIRQFKEKPVNNSLVGCGETATCSIQDDKDHSCHAADIQRPPMPSSDTSQPRTSASGRVCRQYQRRRELLTATNEPGSAGSRLGIASNLL